MIDTSTFEKIIIQAVTVLLMIIIGLATAWLFVLVAVNLWSNLRDVQTALDLQETVMRGLAGVFVVLIALELLETVKTYARDHRVRLEVVLVVGAIAVARHVIQMDFHLMTGASLAGLGALIASLVGGYFLLQRVPASSDQRELP